MLADAPVHADSAMTAASIMAQNNVWYPYVEMADDPALKGLPAQLRMNAIASHTAELPKQTLKHLVLPQALWASVTSVLRHITKHSRQKAIL
jgi:hypothetical protein